MRVSFFGSMKIPALRLVAYDIPKRQATVLDGKSRGLMGGDVLYVDPAGTWALVASQNDVFTYPSVKRVDLLTGEAKVVEKARTDVWDWYADKNGVVRGGLAYNDRRWTLWYREKAGEPLRATKGKFNTDDSAVDSFTFGRKGDGNGIIVTNQKNDRFGAYRYNFNTGQIGETIFEHPDADISAVVLASNGDDVRGVRFEDDRWRTHWIDPEMKALQARLDKAVPNAVNQIVSMSDDNVRALILSSAANDPETYYVLDRKAKTMGPVLEPYDRIDPALLTPVQWTSYAARDGMKIRAYLTLPRGREEKGLPLIVMPHGGPFARDSWTYDPFVQFLANRGYAVLQPQFRGSTGFGRSLVESGYGQYGRKMQDDLDDGVDWLVRSGKVDPKRVCIFGASYGGYAALWGAIRNPDRYRCAISMAGVTDLRSQVQFDRKSFSATRYFKEWRRKVAGDDKTDLRMVSPLNFAANMKVPVLIAHGEADDTVDVKQGRAMVNALTKAKANVTSAFYKKSGHGFSDSGEMEDFLHKVDAFLQQYNPAGP